VPKDAYLNPALVILSVFGGLGVMGFIGIIYGPVIMILLITSIEVYTKYLLRSDLEALQEDGRINLEELGLVSEESQDAQSTGKMFVTALKKVSSRLQHSTEQGKDIQPEVGGSSALELQK
jgi:predicted membrane protein